MTAPGREWAGKCGIYRTLIDGNGIPIAPTENILYGQWSRYANVVFNPVEQVYQVVWVNHTSGGQIFGMRYSLSGTPLDSAPYVVQAPDRTNTSICQTTPSRRSAWRTIRRETITCWHSVVRTRPAATARPWCFRWWPPLTGGLMAPASLKWTACARIPHRQWWL